MDQVEPIEFRRTYVDRQDPSQIELEYVPRLDTVFIDLGAPEGPRATYYVDDGVHIVFDPATDEIVGFRIEDWRRLFLRRHDDLRRPWFLYRLVCSLVSVCGWLNWPKRDRSRVIERVERYAYNPSGA